MRRLNYEINPRIYIGYIFGSVLLAGILLFYAIRINNEPLLTATPNPTAFKGISANNSTIQPLSLLYASTSADQQLGLGGRMSLPSNEGMLFIFSTPGNYAFWMKDMHFPIDMIWMDTNFVITHIESDVSPDSYPKSFSPGHSSSYVLETNAGYSKKNNLSVGETLDFVKNSPQNSL